MRYLLLLFVFVTAKSFAQTPRLPLWDKQTMLFGSTKMKVKNDKTSAVIFEGAKTSTITINDKNNSIIGAGVAVRLGNYFEMLDAKVTKSEFEIDEKYRSITYTASNDKKLCVIIVSYNNSDLSKPSFIIVTINDDWRHDTANKMTFTLDNIQ